MYNGYRGIYFPSYAMLGVPCMRKLKALFLAVCFVFAILVFNIPGVNFGNGPGFVYEQSNEEYTVDD